jgi:hypothetical protein
LAKSRGGEVVADAAADCGSISGLMSEACGKSFGDMVSRKFGLDRGFDRAEWFSRRLLVPSVQMRVAVVETEAMLMGRESAKRPNTRRSQGRPGEPLARGTSTGKPPRSVIHASETETIVTAGLVKGGPFDLIPGPGSPQKRKKSSLEGLSGGCAGRPGGSCEPSREIMHP